MANRLLRYLDIQPAEQRNFNILFLQTLLSGFATSFFFVSATSHFVKTAGVQNLPFAYLVSGIVGFVLVSAYKRLQSFKGIVFSYTSGLVLYAGLCLLLYALYTVHHPSHSEEVLLAYAGLVLIMPFTAIFTLGFSLVSLRVFSFAQSKRLLAMVGTGETVAAIIAFISVPFLMKLIGDSVHLLPASALLVLLAILPVRQLVKNNAAKLSEPVRTRQKKASFDLSFFSKDRFFTAMLLFTFFSVLAIYLADYSYLIAVRYFSVQTEIETASIVAVIFSVIKTGELLFSFLSRTIQGKYGMRVSLILLPCLLILFSGFALGASLLNADPLFLLFFLIINKFNERVIRKGITTPAMKVVYQVTEPAERAQLQTSIEGIFSQVATMVAGGLLMLISLAYKPSQGNVLSLLNLVTIICLVIYAGWLLVSLEVFGRYKQKINRFLFSHKSAAAEPAGRSAAKQWPSIVEQQASLELPENTKALDTADREQLLATIVFYNPSLKDYVQEYDTAPDMFFKRLARAYFSNDHFFSRVAIIWFAAFLGKAQQVSFFRDAYPVSNQVQRLLLVRILNKGLNRPLPAESFYFINLAQDCVKDTMQITSALHDLAELENAALHKQLALILRRQKNLLLELLKLIYDADAMSVIQSVINQHDSSEEHQQFAVELLSNILKPGVKEYVLPVFEDIAFQQKRNSLSALFFIYELPVEERLKDIVMMDVKLVDPYTKQLAMDAYYTATQDKTLLQAFESSHWKNMRQFAAAALSGKDIGGEQQSYEALQQGLRRWIEPSYLSLFGKYGTGDVNKQLPEVSFKGAKLRMDTVGLAVMFALQEQD